MFGLVNSGGERISCHNFSPLLFKNFFVIKKIVFAIALCLGMSSLNAQTAEELKAQKAETPVFQIKNYHIFYIFKARKNPVSSAVKYRL